MNKRWFVALLLIAVGLFLFWRFLNRGAKYDGKTAEQWFVRYCYTGRYNSVDRFEARMAFEQLGSDGIQFLYDEARHPKPDTVVGQLIHELRRFFSGGKLGGYIKGKDIAAEAENLLREFKPPASVVLPLVANALRHPEDTTNYWMAVYMLGSVGEGAEQGVPALAQALRSTNDWTRILATHALINLGRKASPALPQLLEELKRKVVWSSVAIGNLGPEAREALPLLNEKFSSATTTTNDQLYLAVTIYAIDPSRRDAIAAIRDRFAGNDSEKSYALRWLSRVECSTKELIPDFVALAASTNNSVKMPAIEALQRVSTNDAINVLRQTMSSTALINVRVWAAGCFLRIKPHDAEALGFLKQTLSDPSQIASWGNYAIEQVREIALNQREVIALLEKSAQSSDSSMSEAAGNALKKIKLQEKHQKAGRL